MTKTIMDKKLHFAIGTKIKIENNLGTVKIIYDDSALEDLKETYGAKNLQELKEEAEKFAEFAGGYRPINTGKHIYDHWTPILEKRGAYNPMSDPFKMKANKGIVPDYNVNMCPKTLEILSNTVYISLNPDMPDEQVEGIIERCKKASIN